jgi:hypothetical protein
MALPYAGLKGQHRQPRQACQARHPAPVPPARTVQCSPALACAGQPRAGAGTHLQGRRHLDASWLIDASQHPHHSLPRLGSSLLLKLVCRLACRAEV